MFRRFRSLWVQPLAALVILGLALPPLAAPAAAGSRPLVVLELYTSQGCSACPAADAYLAELVERSDQEGLLALSFHVDYWNYMGWRDPYSNAAYSKRQGDYAKYFDTRNVYTPQMVIQGSHQVVGSDRSEVSRAIRAARLLPQIDVTLSRRADGVVLSLPAAARAYNAKVFMVTYDNECLTAVTRGENRGKNMRSRNVVRTLKHIGDWLGAAKRITIPFAGMVGDKGAVLVQSSDSGAILGSAVFNID